MLTISIRAEMAKENVIFEGIVEADKTYSEKVAAKLVNNVTGKTIFDFIKKFSKTEDTKLYTDSV